MKIPQLYLTPSVFTILNKKVTNYILMVVLPGAVWLLSAYFTPHELEKLPDSCHCQYYFQTKDDLHLVEQREKIQILNSDLDKVKISFKDLDVKEIDTLSFSFGSLTNPNLKSNFLTQLGLREYRVKPAYVTYDVIHEGGSELKPIDFKRPDLDYSVVQSVKAYVTGKHSDITINDSGSVITVASELKPKIQLRDFNTIFHEVTRALDSEGNGAENYVKKYFLAKIEDYSLEDEVIFEAYKSLVKIHLDPLQGKGEQTKANKFEIMRPIVEVLIEKSSLETKKRIIGELLTIFKENYYNKIKGETNKFYYRLQVGLLVYADAKFPALRSQVESGIHDVIKNTGRIWYKIYLEEIADQGSEISEDRKSFFSSIGVFRLIKRSEFETIRNNQNSRESVKQFIDDYISLNSVR
ncbi:MAG: hypothetical protein R8G66_26155 [Cytophagales bacterium]|nr:hypothetical protein [Cytophagales bacterium]